ncbi:hypothetical protein [Nostoc parmelioides]|uniref:Uncharacterized protein n=1 Tax=Nostoc parmelioides FACHB-3921 TaxID=2692909 RepID=A0ABR8B9X5_9NOSO|nr:hypothetical protein [Nostoc parmelioides]MBD2250636.1 hypothetical protein [Nostoc parmelioides FACHB-3921]
MGENILISPEQQNIDELILITEELFDNEYQNLITFAYNKAGILTRQLHKAYHPK